MKKRRRKRIPVVRPDAVVAAPPGTLKATPHSLKRDLATLRRYLWPLRDAAMREMTHTGFMHNYMRMYWGQIILDWCRTPEYAFRTALYLNNKYSLDGRDANSHANVAWCFVQHGRGWTEREVFGKVQYMNDRGLERKFDMDAYAEARH
jgi:hypothetical protein